MIAQKVKRIYLVDAHAYLHRSYHALYSSQLRSPSGEPVWALFGFAKTLLMLLKRDKPDYMAVCFDTPEPTFRHQAYKDYKATREEIDDDLKVQLGMAEEMVRTMGIPTVEAPGYEADDIMATLARKATGEGLSVVIVSGDKDALQLVDNRVKVLNEAKGVIYDSDGVAEKLNVRPEQVVDYLTILGDKADNVPGVPGIGAVGASRLLGRFGTLEKLIAAARKGHRDIPPKAAKALVDSERAALKSRELIVLEEKAPIKLKPSGCTVVFKPTEELIRLFTRFGFRSLLRELNAPMGEVVPSPKSAEGTVPAVGRDEAHSSAAGGAGFKLRFNPTEPKALLTAAQKSKRIALAADRPDQPDLLHGTLPMLGIALPDGRSAVFAGEDLEKNRPMIKKLLTTAGIEKVAHDVKALVHLLREAGLELAGKFSDTLVAAYCLNPSRAKYDLRSVLREEGAELPEEERGKSLAREAAVVSALEPRFMKLLKEKKLERLYLETEMPVLEVLGAMEANGIALDRSYLQRLAKEFDQSIARLKKEIDKIAGVEINLKSPKQLGQLLFEKLKLPVVHKTKKGGVSTDEETLRQLAPLHAVPAKIIDYRELTKLKSTYIDVLLEKMDAKTRRVHTRFNQAGTATGRLSSVDPNLQNIPVRTALGRKIRRAFTAGKGNLLLAADYSQIDLRVLAHLSGDKTLCASFASGEDVHLKTAMEVFGLPADQIDKEMRRRAKAVNFGIVYGQSAHGLSQQLGIPFGEAKKYIEAYKKRYSGVEVWLKKTLEDARADGFVKTLLGRIRYLPDISARNFQVRAASERVAGNTPIQGGSADIIKKAMIAVHDKLPRQAKGKAKMLLQVHDELIFELPRGEAQSFAKWVKREMETAVELKVPVIVDVKAGPNWDEMEAVL